MKKLMAVFVLFIGFGFAAQAQTSDADKIEITTKAELAKLTELVTLEGQTFDFVYGVILQKNKDIAHLKTEAEKNEMRGMYMERMLTLIDPSVATAIKANQELYNEIAGITSK